MVHTWRQGQGENLEKIKIKKIKQKNRKKKNIRRFSRVLSLAHLDRTGRKP
jgi:hypothetical protein